MPPAPGDRVVLRHRLPAGSSHPMTDVLGLLESVDPVRVRAADGRVVQVASDDVVALKTVPPRPVSTRAVRALEHAAALAWPGSEHAWLESWLVRAGGGFTARANSCAPLGPVPEDGVQRVRAWYAERGLPARFTQPDRLAVDLPGWPVIDRSRVLTAPVADVAGAEVDVRDEPDDEWLGACRHRGRTLPPGAAGVLRAVVDGELGFARVTRGSEVVAVARGAVTAAPDGTPWLGLTVVEVAPRARRQGLGGRICAGLVAWGAERGAQGAYLQVAEPNTPARALCAAAGFTDHHGYGYALEP
ncbi:N-acetylglutamate synthase, CG3035 family [Rhodococcus antarcticus]|uniref:N-acetylglutamate synthase, CG3035 family n=1 Tax=Rhodococcus antarcticus TaxID=2987751 RepID=UPI003F492A27